MASDLPRDRLPQVVRRVYQEQQHLQVHRLTHLPLLLLAQLFLQLLYLVFQLLFLHAHAVDGHRLHIYILTQLFN